VSTPGADLAQNSERIKPLSSVRVDNILKTPSSSIPLVNTRFAVVDGWYVITNSHAVGNSLNTVRKEIVIVLGYKDGELQPHDPVQPPTVLSGLGDMGDICSSHSGICLSE
jgi:hypothetical protein